MVDTEKYAEVFDTIETLGGTDITCYTAGYDTIQFEVNGGKIYILIDEEAGDFQIEDDTLVLDSGILSAFEICGALIRIRE